MKIKAFTLIEMLMVMALTGLVLTIAWGVYSNFYLFGNEYGKRHDLTMELVVLDEALRRDCRKAVRVDRKEESFVLSGRDSIAYQNHEFGVLRTLGERRDSFFLEPPQWSLDSTPELFWIKLNWPEKTQTYRIRRPAAARRLVP